MREFRVTAPAYVPFEPKTAETRALRDELRERLRELSITEGEILGARFVGALPRGADVENALFYNIGGPALTEAMRHGVVFEHVSTVQPNDEVAYEYSAERAGAALRYWTPERRLAGCAVPLDAVPKVEDIWWAAREGGAVELEGPPRRPGERFLVELEVAGPVSRATPELVKQCVDGFVCALQSHHDETITAIVAPRIASSLGVSEDRVAAHLHDARPSALGTRPRLVHARGAGVQWAPDDDHCVAGEVAVVQAKRWYLRGQARVVTPD